jgi:hexosaminidase
MIRIFLMGVMLSAFVTGSAFAGAADSALLTRYAIIPQPLHLDPRPGTFALRGSVALDIHNPALVEAVAPLLHAAPGLSPVSARRTGKGGIIVTLDPSVVSDEGYVLDVDPSSIHLRAKTPAGIFYGVQTLVQLIPEAAGAAPVVPCVHIEDAPRFAYRGVMLDVARHYMPMSFIKQLVDLLAMQKMNRLHLHLTDSQGWRFQSLKYPKLTQIGAFRKGDPLHTTYDYDSRPSDSLYGGFYTQDQLRDLVQYAAARFVTIVPEIEMPSHSMSALASYPELACLQADGKPYPYPQSIQNEYCTKDSVFTFLEDILTEVIGIFPSTYIHIGGDEADKGDWKVCPIDQQRMKDLGLHNLDELQSYFIQRIEKFVNSKGRQIIGWDEILEGGLAPNAAVMSWRGEEGGIAAAKEHHKVVMTPGDYCYLDHYQSDAPGEPVAFGGLTTLQKAYSYDPVPAVLTSEEAVYIEGVQGNLWTEYVPTASHAAYMIFPRAIALAEVGWSAPERKNFPDFTRRLEKYLRALDTLQINYSHHVFELKATTGRSASGVITVALSGAFGHQIHYTLNGSAPDTSSPVFDGPIVIKQNALLTAAVLEGGVTMDRITKQFILHKAVGKKVTLATEPDQQYNRGGSQAWVNGVVGSNEQFADDEWLGWNGKDFVGTIDFGRPETLHTLRLRFFHKPSSWIWMPKKVSLQTSDDGIHFYPAGDTSLNPIQDSLTETVLMDLHSGTSRYLKITAACTDHIPAGYPGEGGPAWLFVDEAEVD